jgi:hypothetical protein
MTAPRLLNVVATVEGLEGVKIDVKHLELREAISTPIRGEIRL